MDPEAEPKLTGAATVIPVTDFPASLAYYRNVLGFTVEFLWGEPQSYACLCRDEVSIHIVSANVAKHQPGQTGVCIFVRDADAMFEELSLKGAVVVSHPQTYDYGMREFEITDLDRNRLIYGAAAPPGDGLNSTDSP